MSSASRIAAGLVAMAGLSASAAAQSLYLIRLVNLDPYAQSVNPYFVGPSPRGGALVRQTFNVGGEDRHIESLFLTGFNATGATTATTASMMKIEDVLAQYGSPVNVLVPGTAWQMPPGRGYTGMDFRQPSGGPGVDGGLVVSVDMGGGGSEQKIWDVTSGHIPTIQTTAPTASGLRGIAGPAWDMGVGGQGFSVNGTPGSPLIAILDATRTVAGPLGLDPTGLEGASGAELYNPTGGGAILPGPVLNTPDPSGFAVGGTMWRDIDVHPDTGLVVARAYNDVVIAERLADNTVNIVKVIDGPSDLPNNDPGAQVAQECAIMHGFHGGDLIAWNSRVSGGSGQAVGSSLRFANLAGEPVSVQLLDPTTELGTTSLPSNGSGMLGLFWDRGLLVVVDGSAGAGKRAYIFKQCLADVNHDGLVDLGDFFDFFNGFDQTKAPADVNFDGQIDLIDFFVFLAKFDAGC